MLITCVENNIQFVVLYHIHILLLVEMIYNTSNIECPENSEKRVNKEPLYSHKNNTPCINAITAHTNGVYIFINLFNTYLIIF